MRAKLGTGFVRVPSDGLGNGFKPPAHTPRRASPASDKTEAVTVLPEVFGGDAAR